MKSVALAITLALALGLAGCGKRGAPKPPESQPDRYPRTYPAT